ncbi:MAG: N-acetylglucosamine-6-phosphate deacetylase [Rubrobacteraceae bacterium]
MGTIAQSVLVGDAVVPGGLRRIGITIRNGKISEVVNDPHSEDIPADYRSVDGLICPGFIDLQINGAFGIDVGPNDVGLGELATRLPRTGTTAFLPTAISWPSERYEALLEALGKASSGHGAHILGAHIEGPFLSPERKGAHDPENLLPIDLGLLKDILGAGPVAVMTVAPELDGAEKAAELLCDSKVVASVGHTNATYEEVSRAVDAGFSKATHLYNTMSPFEHRAPGAVGAVLTDDRVRAGIIADGVHVHQGALRLAYREKGVEGLALVTDAMEAAGMEDGEYELSGRTVRLDGGFVRLPDGTLAGSSLTMDGAVRNASKFLGIPLEEAVRMASETPAEILGVPEKGRITPGADADLVVLDRKGFVQETIVGGETVYQREGNGHGG